MSEKDTTSNATETSSQVDLGSLAKLSFGPSWADKSASPKRRSPRDATEKSESYYNSKGEGPKRDRRSRNPQGRSGTENRRGFSKRRDRSENFKKKPIVEFKPSYEIKIYPQDDAFDFLVKRLRSNFKTYQLFEITRLILEKTDRLVAIIQPIKLDSEEAKLIYFSTKDGMPFCDEESAIDHFIENHIGDYFDIEEVEVGAPTGNFNLIYRCPFTGVLISPPNFHRFQELLKLHHRQKIKNLSLSDYQNKLESVNDESAINEWIEMMKKGERFTLKNSIEGDSAAVFNSRDDAKRYLVMNKKSEMIKSTESFRLSGTLIDSLPKGLIKENVLFAVESQRRFPLDTANNIRGRLRRHKFTIYKKGSKGISYVCCVKRKFRDGNSVFSESIINLINFIENNQNVSITDLPYKFLSIEKPEVKKPSETKASCQEDNMEAPAAEVSNLSEEDQANFKQFIRDLRWLITEGYVTEYSDGTIFVHPKMVEVPKSKKEPKADLLSSSDTEVPVSTSLITKAETQTEGSDKVEVSNAVSEAAQLNEEEAASTPDVSVEGAQEEDLKA